MFSFETTVFSPQILGGAIVVCSGGVVDLAESVFESNYVKGTLSDSIVNLGGEVHCSITCLPVCTSCQHNDDGVAAPSPNPTTQVVPTLLTLPTLAPKSSPAVLVPVSELWYVIIYSSLPFILLCSVVTKSVMQIIIHIGLRVSVVTAAILVFLSALCRIITTSPPVVTW